MGWWERHFGGSTRGRIVARLRRSQQTVDELADALGITDNAVRAQLATLERDGVVAAAGARRDGAVGKPAILYAVADGADTIFSSAYAPVLTALVAELTSRYTADELESVLRETGRRLVPASLPDTYTGRVHAAADLLAELGGDAELSETDEGFTVRGVGGCPLGQTVAACPECCRMMEHLLAEVTGGEVREECDRAQTPPRCAFHLRASHAS
jgi:predicted ArsR family transcriptional regulator